MTKLISKLRLDSSKGCAKNVWLVIVLIALTVWIQSLAIRIVEMPSLETPSLLIFPFMEILISGFGVCSLLGYAYWIWMSWTKFTSNEGLKKVFSFLGLSVALIMTLLVSFQFMYAARI